MDILDFEFQDEVFYLRIETEFGSIEVMANAEQQGRVLQFMNLHIDGPGPRMLGQRAFSALVREFAQTCLEYADADELIVQGFQRSTGANPGRIPRVFRFRR